MVALRRTVRLRVDGDSVQVAGLRLGRDRTERWDVAPDDDRFAVLERVIRRSPLLRPGRRCEVGIEIESPRTIYRTVQGDASERAGPEGFRPVLPEVVGEVLEPILIRRRVHGPAWFASGPALRAVEALRAGAKDGQVGLGLHVDRSSVAVTVLLIDGVVIRWARGAPSEDAPDVAAHLLRRAAEVVDGAYGLHWWHLTDVSSPSDERRRRREAREFEARCHGLIGHLPRLPSVAR